MKPKWPEITWTFCSDGSGDAPRVLGLNPWVHDFAAYNLWSRPAGLLAALHMLRAAGAGVALMDCMDRTWSDVPWPSPRFSGKSPYPKSRISTPAPLQGIDRRFSRYGHDPERIRAALRSLSPPPDLVLVTTIMTYWYPGAAEAIAMVRDLWPGVPVVLGGIYATLCPEHALTLGADAVVDGRFEDRGWDCVWRLLGNSPPTLDPQSGLRLALDLYREPDFSVILGSRGCPFQCGYCASRILFPGFAQAPADCLLSAISDEYERGVRDFAFYDDALLVAPDTWLNPVLDWFAGRDARLHTPNAVHARYLTPELCVRLRSAGVSTVRLGLETVDFGHRHDVKLSKDLWEQGIDALHGAGFGPESISAYILFGLPDQDDAAVRRTIDLARSCGVLPQLAYYTPIPGSAMFERACEVSPFPLREEPLTQNNSIWPCMPGGYSWQEYTKWKRIVEGRE